MERIKQAVDRAKARAIGEPLRPMTANGQIAPLQAAVATPQNSMLKSEPIPTQAGRSPRASLALDWSHLERQRIVGHSVGDPRSRVFDILRLKCCKPWIKRAGNSLRLLLRLRGAEKRSLPSISPSASLRQPERSALLIDMDLQRPSVADYLGIKCRLGVQDILEQRATLADAIIRADAESCKFLVLPRQLRHCAPPN